MAGHSQRVAPPFDPDRARALLDVVGGVVGEIVLAYLGLWAEAAESVAAQLEEVGLSVRPLPLASDADASRRDPRGRTGIRLGLERGAPRIRPAA